jgi:hypothetical protein
MKKTSLLLNLLILFVIISFPSSILLADPGGPGPQPAPFDGGLSLIIAAGIGYAVKKRYDQRKNNLNKEK